MSLKTLDGMLLRQPGEGGLLSCVCPCTDIASLVSVTEFSWAGIDGTGAPEEMHLAAEPQDCIFVLNGSEDPPAYWYLGPLTLSVSFSACDTLRVEYSTCTGLYIPEAPFFRLDLTGILYGVPQNCGVRPYYDIRHWFGVYETSCDAPVGGSMLLVDPSAGGGVNTENIFTGSCDFNEYLAQHRAAPSLEISFAP